MVKFKSTAPEVSTSHNKHLVGPILELFLSNEAEKDQELSSYVTKQDPTTDEPVPGDDAILYKRSSDPARLSGAALAEWYTDLHRLGCCLNGNATVQSFCVTYLGFLKGNMELSDHLTGVTDDGARLDMASVEVIITTDVYRGWQPPYDIVAFTKLLKNFNKKKSFLVRFNVCHETEMKKCMVFGSMYDALDVLKQNDKEKYEEVITNIKVASKAYKESVIGIGYWVPFFQKNKYLKHLIMFKATESKDGYIPKAKEIDLETSAAGVPAAPSLFKRFLGLVPAALQAGTRFMSGAAAPMGNGAHRPGVGAGA